jgi:Sulfotransferase family
VADNSSGSTVRPLFLLSLPRAGSTLVQRVLASHPKISTTGEPWILLPLVYARRWKGIRAEYAHQLAEAAINEFAQGLPGGPETFDRRLRSFVEDLYGDAAEEGATYFLDKSPHYHFIVDDLIRLFPDAKFVFLWRNPLSVVASILETFRANRFEPYEAPAELVQGPTALASAFDANRERAHAVRYEDLLGENRDEHWAGIFEYLELDWDPQVLERFSGVELRGGFGDPTGRRAYASLSTEPLQKWRQSFRGPVRRIWVARWLKRLGPRPLEIMGYDPERLMSEVRSADPVRIDQAAEDAILLAGSAARRLFRRQALRVQDIPRTRGAAVPSRPSPTGELLQRLRRQLLRPEP